MARNRVIYQSEAVYVTQSGYAEDLTATSGYERLRRGRRKLRYSQR